MKKIFFIFLFVLIFLPFYQSQAAGLVPCGGTGEDPCTVCHFFTTVNNILVFVFKIVPVIAALFLVIGGIMFFLAGAKPEALNQAKGIVTAVFIGLLIIFAAWVIVNTVLKMSGIADPSSSLLKWYEIKCSVKNGIPEMPEGAFPPSPPTPPAFP